MDPVIVVGAGPVGLALALTLGRRAVPCVVLESGDGALTRRAARTCVLRPDTAALLPPLPAQRWQAWRTERRRLLVERVPLDEGASPLHLEQHDLEQALRTAVEREELVRLVTDIQVDEVEQHSAGVLVHARGQAGGWWRGSYLVGCDGPRSTVRKLLGVRFAGRTAVERRAVAALRTQLPWSDEALLHRDLAGNEDEVWARPLPDGVWRLDWLLPRGGELVTPEELLTRVEETLDVWHGGPGTCPPYELLDTGVHTCHQRLARHWRVGRAFLAGDAAHLVGALGVQAVDEGLRDAANLGWKLALAWHSHTGADPDSHETLLDSYEKERRGALGRRLRAVDQALPVVRRTGVRLRGLLPGGTRGHLSLLADGHLGRGSLGSPPVYDHSPLEPVTARGTALADLRPGATVRDVPVTLLDGTRARLHERLGGCGGELAVLLVAPGTAVWESHRWRRAGLMPELASAVRELPVSAELLVTEAYPGAAAHTVLAIRPDGHLAAAVHGVRTADLRACADAVRGVARGQGLTAR